ncbi:cupin domain-containing protein [Flavobacterium sp.]|uniref:cupin domain-containing protein n=1 Tax=Flavobacterium sp. TaxID=239 RepID=UPI002BCDC020|nr:cupin domain-containing protein [Flavobacterium sp.]HSD06088.1 cupin domain-containing protein [Flavobacterium sp.]
MKTKKNLFTAIVTIVLIGTYTISACAQTKNGIGRIELQRHDISTLGREMVQAHIDFEPGTAFGNHNHPGEEIIYVLEGELEYIVEGKSPVVLKKGEVLFIPAGTIHSAKNVGNSKASELATYIVEKGKPLVQLIK